MPLLRTLTTKIKTAISPSPSPTASPTSPSFHVVSGRKEGGLVVKRSSEVHIRIDSFLDTHEAKELAKTTTRSGSSSEGEGDGNFAERKQRRLSRFREELGAGGE